MLPVGDIQSLFVEAKVNGTRFVARMSKPRRNTAFRPLDDNTFAVACPVRIRARRDRSTVARDTLHVRLPRGLR